MSAIPPPTDRLEAFIERSPYNQLWFAYAFGAVVAGFDYLAGPELLVPTYFVLPVMLLAWNSGLRAAITLSALLSAAHIGFLFMWGKPPASGLEVINALMRISVLLILATVTARLGVRTRASRVRVQMLEGILPTCAFCKDIRDGDGQWEPIEAYVAGRSQAKFSHGICPTCADKHYGVKLTKAGVG